MQSHYEVNVSLNGQHLFATNPRSCVTWTEVSKVHSEIVKRFPESEGFSVMVTHMQCVGEEVNMK